MNEVPSHQLIVEVTGFQYPSSGLAGGYLICGKNPIFAIISNLGELNEGRKAEDQIYVCTCNSDKGWNGCKYTFEQRLCKATFLGLRPSICAFEKWKELCT